MIFTSDLDFKIFQALAQSQYTIQPEIQESPRALGDFIEHIMPHVVESALNVNIKNDHSRRSMADFSFQINHKHYIVDVKTERDTANFHQPNLVSIKRLWDFYANPDNTYLLLFVKYKIDYDRLVFIHTIFTPIEFISWDSLTIENLGWGQIQVKAGRNVNILYGNDRGSWINAFRLNALNFYSQQMDKVIERRKYFLSPTPNIQLSLFFDKER